MDHEGDQEREGQDSERRKSAHSLSRKIIGAAMKVHSALGPGLLESAYELCLAHELRKLGCDVKRQVVLPLVYDGLTLDAGYRLDMLVNDLVIIETKTCEAINRVHEAQIIS